jgi:predicted enzyme related to lactoylglutathione lyase
MTSARAQVLGRLVWTELMTTDPGAAQTFYGTVLGWTSEPFDNSPMPYWQFMRDGGVGVAGLMETPAGMNMPPFWSMYIAVPQFEDALGRIKLLGGSEMSEVIDVPTVGRMQMVRDPEGAAFYIIQPVWADNLPPNMPDPEPEVGDVSWLELMTTDVSTAMRFYQQLFGWEPSQAIDMGPMGTYQEFNRGRRMIGGMMNKPKEMAEAPPYWGIYFRVADINVSAERVKANGGTILNGPMEVPGGDWVLSAMDPQGAAFALHAKRAG